MFFTGRLGIQDALFYGVQAFRICFFGGGFEL